MFYRRINNFAGSNMMWMANVQTEKEDNIYLL